MTRTTHFVRAIWGQGPSSDAPVASYGSAIAAAAHPSAYQRNKLRDQTVVYCWGEWNFQFISNIGWVPTLASHSSIQNFAGDDTPHSPTNGGRINYGISMWRHKLESMRLAMQTWQEIVWLDWDVHIICRLPSEFWEHLRDGQPLRLAQKSYTRPQCNWRDGRDNQRISLHGAMIYCRDASLIDDAIRIMHTEYPNQSDEQSFAKLIDDRTDGWLGINGHREHGYDLPMYDPRRLTVLKPEPPIIFRNEGVY